MHVGFVSWRDLANHQAGGCERVVDALARGLVDRGHRVTLICGGPVGARPYAVVAAGGTYSQYVLAPRAARRQRPAFDLIVDVENGLPYFSPWWWQGARLLFVQHVHTEQWALRFPRPVAALGRLLESRVMPWAYRRELVVVPSESTRASLAELGFDRERIDVLHLGTDAPAPAGVKGKEPMFLALGRLVPHKRIRRLLDIWRIVQPVVGGTLVIAGTGPEDAELRRLGGKGVHFTGAVSEGDKARLLGECWLLVHAAMHEGWGMVVMEAAAAGTPTLAFDVAGIRDAVVPGVTGELVNTDAEFAAVWRALAGDPDRRSRLGKAARTRASTFGWPRTIDEFEAFALRAVEEHARRVG
jgi:glycosyltransferase involved in cell wall biosynthesis